MKQESMTALVSAFARASHAAYNSGAEQIKVFYDPVARLLFTQEEYQQICRAMADGIGYFCPDFTGSREEALRWIVDRHLSPPLGRAAFAEGALETAVRTGTRQYLILGAGYDTFAYRQPDWAQSLQIFELDRPATIADKKRRLKQGGIPIPPNVEWTAAELTDSTWSGSLQTGGRFQTDKLSLCSLLGLSYYLEERIGHVCSGSSTNCSKEAALWSLTFQTQKAVKKSVPRSRGNWPLLQEKACRQLTVVAGWKRCWSKRVFSFMNCYGPRILPGGTLRPTTIKIPTIPSEQWTTSAIVWLLKENKQRISLSPSFLFFHKRNVV